MTTMGQRIKFLREEREYTQEQFGAIIGVSKSTIGMYELDKREPDKEKLEAIADFFNVDMDYLYGKSDYRNKQEWLLHSTELPANIVPLPDTKKVPLLGKIACGSPITAEENVEDYVDVPEFTHADFALTCQGDSMIGARILDGDIVYIRLQPEVENGEIAAVLIDGEATLKRVYYQKGKIILQPENNNYPPLIYEKDEILDVRILGKATYFMSKVK